MRARSQEWFYFPQLGKNGGLKEVEEDATLLIISLCISESILLPVLGTGDIINMGTLPREHINF